MSRSPAPSRAWSALAILLSLLSPKKGGLLLFVVLPTAITILYQGIIASDIYVSESAFSVRGGQNQAASSIEMLLVNAGLQTTQQDQFTVNTYIQSRAMVETLMKDSELTTIYRSPKADRFARLAEKVTLEQLTEYFRKMNTITYDERAVISTLQVRAFTAVEAQALNKAILAHAEAFVNTLSDKMRRDAIAFAEDQLKVAEDELAQANTAMSSFREKHRNFDPAAMSAGTTGLIQSLQSALAEKRAEREAARGVMTASNPHIRQLDREIAALERQVGTQTTSLTGNAPASMTKQMEEYASVALKQQFAGKRYGLTLAALEAAQAEAGRQTLYLSEVVSPSMPDEAIEPRRLYRIATVFFLSLTLYGLMLLIAASVQDHIRK